MLNRKIKLLLIVFYPLLWFAQVPYSPVKHKYKGQEYFVYPVRNNNIKTIPPTAFTLPDGKYLIFCEYDFKKNKRKKKMVLMDTTQVSGICAIKNNLPEGYAEFYYYHNKWSLRGNNVHNKKNWSDKTFGNYNNGLKEGLWTIQVKGFGKTIEHFKEGVLEGEYLDYNSKNILTLRKKFRNGEETDTVFAWYDNGKLNCMYDYLDEMRDTVLPEKNFADLVFENHSVFHNLKRYSGKIRSFYKEYSPSGKQINDLKLTNGRNPVFDTLSLDYNQRISIKKLNNDAANPRYMVSKVQDNKTYRSVHETYYSKENIYKTRELSYSKKTKSVDSTVSSLIDFAGVDFSSWKDTIYSIKNYSTFGYTYHLIPALNYAWEENSFGRKADKPLSIDTVTNRVYIRDTLGYSWQDVRVAREITYWKREKENYYQKNGVNTLRFLGVVSDLTYETYFTNNVYHSKESSIREYSDDFEGTAWANTYLENDKPINGNIILVSDEKILKKNKFTIHSANYENASTIETGNLLNGIRNGKWEFVILKRKKNISENAGSSFRLKPKDGESYLVANFTDGEADGLVQNYQTEELRLEKYNKDSSDYVMVDKTFLFKEYEANYSKGFLNGSYKTFYYTGKPKLISNLNMGKTDGRVEFYTETGELQQFANYKNDSLYGEYAEFIGGKKNVEAYFENNRLKGNYTVFDIMTGKPVQQINADKNIVRSKKLFFDNGDLKEEMKFADSSKTEFGTDIAGYDNFLEQRKRKFKIIGEEKMFATYTTFFENGKILCNGNIIGGFPKEKWSFYNVAGTLTNEVHFKDTVIGLAGEKDSAAFVGKITGYFNNGKIRCRGFVYTWTSGYDCSTHQDKTAFEIFYTDAWDYEGKQILKSGNGNGIIYDENGNKIADGEYVNFKRNGLWKFYDPSQKLNETGKYVNGNKDGLWFEGDLENMNFEDGACFDQENKEARKSFEYAKRELNYSVILYKNGDLITTETFETNLNKTKEYEEDEDNYRPRRGRRYRAKF
ncbi:MAG: hypothetical protein IAF38_14250 [Bacteroidia bacterium]|nr:hypothetical protein [Bacteroidia bacterium]